MRWPRIPNSEFRRRLLWWFDREKRDLPWRRTMKPYAIWVAEVMLQQTRVEAVVPYYGRFMARFPTLAALAGASWEEVAARWASLGYHARARNLHAAAREVVARHGRRLTPAAPVSPTAAGAFNQALMELGATICTPQRPKCSACPLSKSCRAHAGGEVEAFPSASPRRRVPTVHLTVAAVFKNGRILLSRRPLEGLWGGLREIPQFEPPPDSEGKRPLLGPAQLARRIEGSIRAFAWQMGSLGRGKDGMMRWVRIGQVTRYPISAYCRKVLAAVAPT